MHGEAVKNEDVAGVDSPADPGVSACRFPGDDAGVGRCLLQSVAVRAREDLQRSKFSRAVVKWHPGGEVLDISGDGVVVLMRYGAEVLGVGKDEARDGLGVDQKVRAYEEFHRLAQSGMVRECVEGFEIEDLIADALEGRVGIVAGSAGVCNSVEGIAVGLEPSGSRDNLRDLGKQAVEILGEQEVADERVAVDANLLTGDA